MGKIILGKRDKAVYAWELETLYPHDSSRLSHAVTHSIVQHVWRDMGLTSPPKVTFDNTIPDGGWGTRTELTFKLPPNHVLLFHELAHAMDTSLEEELGIKDWSGSSHNENWLGFQVKLLDRYVGGTKFNLLTMMTTLHQRGLDFSLSPTPRCL